MSDEEEERRRRAEAAARAIAVELLHRVVNSETTNLDTSDRGYLREVAMDIEAGKRPGWMDRLWTLRLLYRFHFGR
jgi:hypothetical protein